MFPLSKKWYEKLSSQGETGMGYQIVSVVLTDGQRFDQVVVDSGYITKVRGRKDIPFSEEDIADITVTHDKWDFSEGA